MKIYISADIEGITGTTDWNEVTKGDDDYTDFRQQMTNEVCAACEGAFEAGATQILIKDAHSTARNLIASQLPKKVKLVRGWSRHPYMMMQEINKSFDAAFMIGYHSAAGAGGNPLAHTISSANVADIEINGHPLVSEFFLNTYTAALEQVPVVFLSGDKGICNEAKKLLPEITTVSVKEGFGGSTINIHPDNAIQKIREKSKKALKKPFAPFQFELPEYFTVKITFFDIKNAYKASFYPGSKLISPKTVLFETENYFDVLRMLMFTL
ncbi:MAG: M55 family metallopeptidase [Thermodesulfobacteriota bacterium]